MSRFFEYGPTQTQWLASRDLALGAAIAAIGPLQREIRPDIFSALIHSIVGQQISSKAQETVWRRVETLCGAVTPESLDALNEADLQSCGLSLRKVSYAKGCARAVLIGELDLQALHTLPDDAVCKELCRLNGIGTWTAEMLMIFAMQRPNILSWSDLAIQRGIRMLYRHRTITPQLFKKYYRRYSPYATTASLYLWAIAGGGLQKQPA